MRISDWSSDVCSSDLAGQAVPGQCGGDLQAQPLDPEGRRHLADIAAGIGEAELKTETAGAPDVIAEMRRAQRVLDDAVAMLHRLLGLEQRRDLDQMLDAEDPREIERDEEGEGGLGLGDQEADRRGGIDVLRQFRDRSEEQTSELQSLM